MNHANSELDRRLRQALCNFPRRYDNRYNTEAETSLLETLFRALTNDREDYLRQLFPNGFPTSYRLQDAQGAEAEPEYSAAARGTLCGHIFRQNEVTYHCGTCTDDQTAVLCARCFAASDHEGHKLHITVSQGNSGCCDCGDDEAWKRPVHCAIHTANDEFESTDSYTSALPEDLQASVRTTIARVADYFCDVISCSPEHLRLPKSIESIKEDEARSRLNAQYYVSEDDEEANPEFSLVIWNDEKHTVMEVQQQVARACKQTEEFGLARAIEAHNIGRSVVQSSRNLKQLTEMAKIIEQIKITVTIRASRDTFREQMCGTIVNWLSDIAGSSLNGDHHILRRVVCEELLQIWRVGSRAWNARTGEDSLDQHGIEEGREQIAEIRRIRRARLGDPLQLFVQPTIVQPDEDNAGEDDDENEGVEVDFEDDEEESNAGDERARDILRTTVVSISAIDQVMDTDATDDADEMDTDGDGEFMDDFMQASPPPNPDTEIENAATPTPGHRRGSETRPNERNVNFMVVPKTHHRATGPENGPHGFWLMPNVEREATGELPPHEDLTKSIRLDYMIIFDLRLWKIARIGLRELYISTIVKIPEFKRILGLRFSGLYTTLAQLYLIADREPDHSIMSLSLQILTTPSICQERIEKGNFLTNIMAIIYTFLTNRQVGFAEDIDSHATLSFDPGAVANRRLFHFFGDLKYFLASEHVQAKVRSDSRYLSQYLDLMKLLQGICPNVRAVGEHVEYETDTWISASVLTRESNKLCRTFAEAYRNPEGIPEPAIYGAIYAAAGVAMINSLGLERRRFEQNEIRELISFHQTSHPVVDFDVAHGALSFHHPLHYTLSWLLETGKESSRCIHELRSSAQNVVDRIHKAPLAGDDAQIKSIITTGEDALMAMFDYPLRVCAWLAQMKANMWVRNGMSLRHQMSQYKSVGYRDVAHQRDLFLLQTALVACDPARVLSSMIDRYRLSGWMSYDYSSSPDCDDVQTVDLAEDFICLLINLLSDRDNFTCSPSEPDSLLNTVRKEVAHSLCFKPLSYSELMSRLTERVHEHPKLQDVLEVMTKYRPPEGLHDTGLFELKEEYLQELDPYNSHFSKNQRDEAENIYRKWLGKKLKKDPEDVVLEPKLLPITSEAYKNLADVSQCELFAHVVYRSLAFVAGAYQDRNNITVTRAEALLHNVLHLAMIAALEDQSADEIGETSRKSFIRVAINTSFTPDSDPTIVSLLHKIWLMDEYTSCRSKLRHILRLFNQRKPTVFAKATQGLNFPSGRFDTASPANMESELEAKKRQSEERKARVMAQFQQQQKSFMEQQGGFIWEEDELDSPDAELPSSTESRAWKFPSGLCIQCREETSDAKLYGTFAMITDGHLLRETNLHDAAFVNEVLNIPRDLDRTLDRTRPFGIASSNNETISQMDSAGNESKVERQSVSKGWPRGHTAKGPVTSSCGHIMHFSCYENYFQSVMRRHSQQVARQHPDRVSLQEFVCPLCKALANAFLPIVWKSTEQSYPGALETRLDFSDFMETERNSRDSALTSDYDIRSSHFHRSNLSTFANSALEMAIERSQATDLSSPTISGLSERPEVAPLAELASVYLRLKEPFNNIAWNTQQGVFPSKFRGDEQANSFHLLLNSLANTICTTEIAYRGREAEFGTSLLTGIPQQTLSHLQILSSTIRSYAATCHILVRGGIDEHFQQVYLSLHGKLYGESHKLSQLPTLRTIFMDNYNESLLQTDPFTFFVHASMVLCPILEIDHRHMLRLALTSEIIRTIIACVCAPDGLIEVTKDTPRESRDHVGSELLGTIVWLSSEFPSVTMYQRFESLDSVCLKSSFLYALHHTIEKYVLAYLRKCAIFCHVALGIDFPTTAGSEASLSELDRLLHFMQLPSISEILSDLQQFSSAFKVQRMVANWVKDLGRCAHETTGRALSWEKSWDEPHRFDIPDSAIARPYASFGIRLLHPAPLELIGLPKYYDVLMELSSRTVCPTTGKELVEPALCLFCGAIFCSQAVCCQSDDGRGGCNQHIEKCSAPIGIFILIRKCCVVMLHLMKDPHQNRRGTRLIMGGRIIGGGDLPPPGSFFPAPYLTKHGETDGGLRNKHQLMLSQMRYDRLLRDTWLMVNGSVWSAIARRLEAEVNTGAWETL